MANQYAGTVKVGGGGVSVSSPRSEKKYSYTRSDGTTSTTSDYRHSDAAKAATKANLTSSTQTSNISNGGGGGGTSTVQPVFVSGASENNTYRIVNQDGTSYQFAASGISLSDASKYYAERAAKAQASGDTATAAKFNTAAGDFAAASNYETSSGIKGTYGVGTGLSYDASYALALDASGKAYLAKESVIEYQAGYGIDPNTNSLVTTKAQNYYGASLMSRSLVGESISNDEGSVGAGDPAKVVSADESAQDVSDAMKKGSDLVDAFGNLPQTLAESGTVSGAVGSFVATVLLPTDAVRVGKMLSDGKGSEITALDYAYAAVDIISLIPFFAPLKALKVLKLTKIAKPAGVLGLVGSIGVSATDTAINGLGGDGNPDQTATPTPEQTPETPFIPDKTTTDTTTQPQPEQNVEYDMSGITDILSQLFAGSGQAGESGGSGGGSDVTIVTNSAQPIDYSKYILPAVGIIGGIVLVSALIKSGNKGGASA